MIVGVHGRRDGMANERISRRYAPSPVVWRSRREGGREGGKEGSPNRRRDSELDASVAAVLENNSKSSDEHSSRRSRRSSAEERREGADEAASRVENDCGGSRSQKRNGEQQIKNALLLSSLSPSRRTDTLEGALLFSLRYLLTLHLLGPKYL